MGNGFSESRYKNQIAGHVQFQGLRTEKILWEGIVIKYLFSTLAGGLHENDFVFISHSPYAS